MKQLFTILCEHFSTVLIHPQFSISHHIQDMPAQLSVLTLAAMVEHHAVSIVNGSDIIIVIPSFLAGSDMDFSEKPAVWIIRDIEIVSQFIHFLQFNQHEIDV